MFMYKSYSYLFSNYKNKNNKYFVFIFELVVGWSRRSMLKRTMVQAKKFIYAKRFDGLPKLSDFKLEEEALPELKDGDVLVEALYLSVDPYMRAYMDQFPVGVTMIGGQVSKVLESKDPKFPKDSIVHGSFGWRSHTIFNPSKNTDVIRPYVLPPFGNLPLSLGLGHLGMPGNTAYFGFLDICKPKSGEVVVITGAAGAVGSLVGQIAKINGCKVIGLAGSEEKCEWLKSELGFDHAINYKTANISDALKAAAPDGIDCYFDNVGGEISSVIMGQMRDYGRIAVCGAISVYNAPMSEWPKVPILQPLFVFKQLTMKGFLIWAYAERWFEGIAQVQKYIEEGKVKYHETTTNGFLNTPQAFIDMLQGKNTGKAIVKA